MLGRYSGGHHETLYSPVPLGSTDKHMRTQKQTNTHTLLNDSESFKANVRHLYLVIVEILVSELCGIKGFLHLFNKREFRKIDISVGMKNR